MKMDLFIIAGEASADSHAAALVRELKIFFPDMTCYGVGGSALAAEGMEIIIPASALNIVGLTEAFDRFREVWRCYRALVRLVKKRGASCAILLDLPDFNLLMASKLRRYQIPVVYYISPQIWAWRTYRIHKIKKLVNKMLVLFPFEKDFYQRFSVSVDFVGHPLLDSLSQRPSYRQQDEIVNAPRIAILPGSRKSEIKNHGPILQDAVKLLIQKFPNAVFRLPVASTLDMHSVSAHFAKLPVQLETNNSREILNWADVALVASGTATLETSLIGTPFTLFYRLSSTTYRILRYFFPYRGFAGLPNLLSKKEVVREFIQNAATPGALFSETSRLIEDQVFRHEQRDELLKCRELLGQSGASIRAALSVKTMLEKKYEKTTPLLFPSPA